MVITQIAGLAAVACLAWLGHAYGGFTPSYLVKCVSTFAVVMIAVFRSAPASHPFDRFGAANQITTLRAVLTALVIGSIGEAPVAAVAATASTAGAIAAVLDGIDGWLARRTRIASRFGARFDMEIDAMLILGLAVLAWTHAKAGPWVIASGLLRYVFVAGGWLWPWLTRPLPPSRRRQTICVVQVVGLVVAVSPIVAPGLSTRVAAIALIALCGSFLTDTLWLWRTGTPRTKLLAEIDGSVRL